MDRSLDPTRDPTWPLTGSYRTTTHATPLVGRTRELAGIRRALSERRLVTLTGVGGAGKTRLAAEVAHVLEPELPAVFVELASVGDDGFVSSRVAEVLGLDSDVRDPAHVARAMPEGLGLLVLDNCEHVLDGTASLVRALLPNPDLRILATSREALGLPGERVWPLGPLPHDGGESEALHLLLERARDVAPGFEPAPEHLPLLETICRRLEGMPLALELAAARLKVLTPAQLLEGLDDMHAVLRTGGRPTNPRHRSLASTLRWSYEHLDPESRRAFRRLSVFRGGFTLAGARAVSELGEAHPSQLLDALEQLVDRSLLGVREVDGASRYFMLEPLRQLGEAELARDVTESADACRSHAEHMLVTFEEAEPFFLTSHRRAWTVRTAREIDNLRAALRRTREPHPSLHARLAATAWWFWFSTRHWTEARRWLEDACTMAGQQTDAATRGRLAFALGALDALQARPEDARRRLEQAVALARETGDDQAAAYALTYLGMAHAQQARPDALPVLAEARAWFEAKQDLYGLRLSLLLQGTAIGASGALDEAIRVAERGVDVARVFGQDRELAVALQTLGGLHLRRDEAARAEELFMESLQALLRDPADMFTARALHLLGLLKGRQDDPAEAGRLIGMAETLRERIGAPPFELDRALIDAEVARLTGGPSGHVFVAARSEGRASDVHAEVRDLCDELVGPCRAARTRTEPSTPDVAEAPSAPAVQVAHGPIPDLEIRALGPMEVAVRGQVLDPSVWSYAKPRELLVYLATHRPGRTRDEIATSLWPQTEPDRLKNSFHVTLHHLRKALGDPGWVVIDGDRYRIPEDRTVRLDLHAFESALEALPESLDEPERLAECRAILNSYRGDFLGDLQGVRWHEPLADRARQRFASASTRLALALETRGRLEEAVETYQRLVALDELNEDAQRGLMRTLAANGRRAHALRQFERLSTLLERELGAAPEPETVALRDTLREPV